MQNHVSTFLRQTVAVGLIAVMTFALAGCGIITRREHHRSSSVVAFLFPEEQPLPQNPGLPVLQLPLRVGLAFVPEEHAGNERFTQSQKQVLLERVATEFRQLPFVQSIQTVPELYLRRAGGFQNLDQVQRLLGVDVIVLLSYDQAQFSSENKRSLAYWTIVGAYFVNGNQNDTHTLMEATVYDISSRTLLFHAPGVDQTRASSSLVYAEKEMRQDSSASLERATGDLVRNLQTELMAFKVSVREGRSVVKIEHRPGYSGGGAFDAITIGALVLAWGGAVLGRRRKGDVPLLAGRD